MTILILAILLLLMLLGVPIFVVICGLALFLLFTGQIDSSAMIIEMHRMATTPVLVAIPLFTFAGYLLSESNAPKRLIRASDALLGRVPGGLVLHLGEAVALFAQSLGDVLVAPATTTRGHGDLLAPCPEVWPKPGGSTRARGPGLPVDRPLPRRAGRANLGECTGSDGGERAGQARQDGCARPPGGCPHTAARR